MRARRSDDYAGAMRSTMTSRRDKRAAIETRRKAMKTRSIKLRAIGLLLGCAGTLGMAVAANAHGVTHASANGHKSSVVRYDDLNLDTAAGIKVLYARLSNAASHVCGSQAYTVDLRGAAAHRACFDSALNNAVEKIGNQNLQALHQDSNVSHRVG